jgi:short-subunit dehydrogenase
MNIIITGASSGIGRELALQCAKANHNVIAISRSREKLESLSSEYPDKITSIPFDLNQIKDFGNLKNKIENIIPHVDVLVNNAGKLISKDFLDFSLEDFDDIYNTNVKAPYFLTQKLWSLIEKSVEKQIINIGSVGGVMNTDKFPGLSIYSSSKGAISILTECLAKELSSKGGVVNCLALGAVQTEMLEEAFPGYKPNITAEKMATLILTFIGQKGQIINGKVLQLAGVEV